MGEQQALALDTLILEQRDLQRARQMARSGDSAVMPALKRLKDDAERALLAEDYSVTYKKLAPPNGDKHDYMSLAPYWWPNPNTPHGLPYIRRDGAVNPARDHSSDRKSLAGMTGAVTTLGVAYFFTGSEEYSGRAAELLRLWFLHDATRMNPHLQYAQAVPGRSAGRSAGIIETHDLPDLLDAVALLKPSRAWTETDHQQLQLWFSRFLRWLLESSQGREEARAKNNHGTWYDVQVASYALFTGQERLAREVLGDFGKKRIATQIEADGRQPHEVERTQAWHYSIFNLLALFKAAAIAGKIGIDLWATEPNNPSLRKAIDWLVPFGAREKKWPFKEVGAFEPQKLAPLLRQAALRYHEPYYEQAIAKLRNISGDERWQLLHAKLSSTK
jgi:hypothetical protein